MNFKNYIRLDHEDPIQLTEKEELLYNSILERANGNTAAKKRFDLWKVLAPVISGACAIAIALTCIFTLNTSDNIVYNHEKVESKVSTFSEMQSDINYFDLTNANAVENEVTLYYDIQSSDKLYYTCKSEIDLNTVELAIVIKERYEYEFELDGDTFSKQLTDYTVTYSSESSRGKPQINYKGWIKVKTETVYFDYMQTLALGDDAFFESIQQIIRVKK